MGRISFKNFGEAAEKGTDATVLASRYGHQKTTEKNYGLAKEDAKLLQELKRKYLPKKEEVTNSEEKKKKRKSSFNSPKTDLKPKKLTVN